MKKRKKRVLSAMQIPVEVALGGVNISVYEDKSCIIENANHLISYDNHFIRVSSQTGVLCVKGRGMEISECSQNRICIFGKINGFFYEGGEVFEE